MARIRFYYEGSKDGGWRTARAVTTLGKQVEAAWPERHPADGTVAGSGHAGWPASDHGIDPQGLVRAIDVGTIGVQGQVLFNQLLATEDERIAYVIHDGKIFSSYRSPWVVRLYGGSNPHRGHIHISMMRDIRAENPELFDIDLGSGGLNVLTIEQLQEALNEAGQTDPNGDELVVDGKYGPNTKYAFVKGLEAIEYEDHTHPHGHKENEWFTSHTHGGVEA